MNAAFSKLKAHNMAEMKSIEDYELLYSDASVVESFENLTNHLNFTSIRRSMGKRTVALHFTYL